MIPRENQAQNKQKYSGILGKTQHFPLGQIIIGVILVNVPTFKEISLGGLIGFSTIGLVLGLLSLTGHLSDIGIDTSAMLLQSILYHTFFAFLQDIIYFCIFFRIIEKSMGSWIAVLIASIVFGFKHLLFPGYTLWSVFAQTLFDKCL